MKYLIFHQDVDDSYMNTVRNFRGAYAATETIDIYFKAAALGGSDQSTGYDKITCAVTNGQEDRVVEQLAAQLGGPGVVKVIADDVNSIYSCQDILSVTSITLNATGNFKHVIPATFSTADTGGVDNRIIATNANSGSVFTVNAGTDAASTIYLPASPVTGWNCKFLCNHPSDAHTITVTENGGATAFMGVSIQGGGSVEHTGTASAVIAASDFKLGDFFEVVWDGTIWNITGMFDTAASLAVGS